MSFFPKLLIGPISEAIDPYFASTLVWEGMSLEMIYGYWNPVPVMTYAVAVSAILFAFLWLLQRSGRIDPTVAAARGRQAFYDFCRPLFAALTPPLACKFWSGATEGAEQLAGRSRLIYTGNGQTYSLYILYYFFALYALGGGFDRIWAAIRV